MIGKQIHKIGIKAELDVGSFDLFAGREVDESCRRNKVLPCCPVTWHYYHWFVKAGGGRHTVQCHEYVSVVVSLSLYIVFVAYNASIQESHIGVTGHCFSLLWINKQVTFVFVYRYKQSNNKKSKVIENCTI